MTELSDSELTVLERAALDAALSGSSVWLSALRSQVPKLRVAARKYTGYGFFTDFSCNGCVPATGLPPQGSSERVPVAWASHPEVENGGAGAISFNVFLKDGVIACLEAASTSQWPDTEERIVFDA